MEQAPNVNPNAIEASQGVVKKAAADGGIIAGMWAIGAFFGNLAPQNSPDGPEWQSHRRLKDKPKPWRPTKK